MINSFSLYFYVLAFLNTIYGSFEHNPASFVLGVVFAFAAFILDGIYRNHD